VPTGFQNLGVNTNLFLLFDFVDNHSSNFIFAILVYIFVMGSRHPQFQIPKSICSVMKPKQHQLMQEHGTSVVSFMVTHFPCKIYTHI